MWVISGSVFWSYHPTSLTLAASHGRITRRFRLWNWRMIILSDATVLVVPHDNITSLPAFGSASWSYHLTLLPLAVRNDHITRRFCFCKCVLVISLDAPAFRSTSCSYDLTLLPLEVLHKHITWAFCLWKCLIIYHLTLLVYRTSW